jgi:hypothetical protein
MRVAILALTILVPAGFLVSESRAGLSVTPVQAGASNHIAETPPNTLCAKDERVIFSCLVKRPAKIVSLCAAKDLTSDRGYLQYRFGLPGKIELEYPKDRQATQQKFQYMHYFRAQVDETEISFQINGYEYQIFDTYNGEERPPISTQGVNVTAPGRPKEVSFACRTKPKADYSDLQAVLPGEQGN